MNLPRCTFYADTGCAEEDPVISEIKAITESCRGYGCRRVTAELRHRGMVVNSKKVRRIMREGVISDATMSRFMERKEMKERPHGFRSSLRTWLADATDAPETVAESIMAHVTGTAVERAYRRTDFLDQRRVWM